MGEKEFVFEKTVYLTDTNLFGNTYFARYFDWQGMAREAFFKRLIGDFNKFMQSRIKLVTIEAHIKYHHEVTLYDEVIIKVKADNIKVATADLIFTYLNKKTNKPNVINNTELIKGGTAYIFIVLKIYSSPLLVLLEWE